MSIELKPTVSDADNNTTEGREETIESNILLRMQQVLERSLMLIDEFRRQVGPFFTVVFDYIIGHIDIKIKILKPGCEFSSEFDKQKFYN